MGIVECLNCGQPRRRGSEIARQVISSDCCPRCGYVGWAPSNDLSEATRRLLRDRPVARRRLLIIA